MKIYTVKSSELNKYRNGGTSQIHTIHQEILDNAPKEIKSKLRNSELFLDYYRKPLDVEEFRIPYCFTSTRLEDRHLDYLHSHIIIVEWKIF